MACETFVVQDINEILKERVLASLAEGGAEISGDNPYDVTISNPNIKLLASWYSDRTELHVTIENLGGVICKIAERKIRKKIKEIRENGLMSFSFTLEDLS